MVAGPPAEVVAEDSAGGAGAAGVGFAPSGEAPPAVWVVEEGELVVEMGTAGETHDHAPAGADAE